MTTPDLPDFETLTSPDFQLSTAHDVAATTTLISVTTQARLWGLFISASYGANSSYTSTTGNDIAVDVGDNLGNEYATINLRVGKASDAVSQGFSLPLYGFIGTPSGGFFTVTLNFPASVPTNTILRASAGIFFSQP